MMIDGGLWVHMDEMKFGYPFIHGLDQSDNSVILR